MRAHASRSAVVVGGGIGGLATAVALQQDGWQARVFERGSAGAGGAGLVLSPNAVRCLAALGIEEAIRSRATVLARSSIRRPDGRALARVDLANGDGPTLGILRADLVDVLAAALVPGTLELGREVFDMSALAGDLVVGADGLRSVVRSRMAPAVQPVFRGYTAWRALLPHRLEVPDSAATLAESWGRGERFGMVPVGPGSTYVYACANAVAGVQSEDELGDLRRRFAGWHAPIPDLLAGIDPGTLLRHDIYDLPPGVTPLHRGKFVLVGDAGHATEPNLGQGAGLALEDAVVLARALAAEPSIDAGLARYARERAPRVTALARQSRRVGLLAQGATPGVVALRDLSLRLTPTAVARRAARGATAWRPPSSPEPTRQEIR